MTPTQAEHTATDVKRAQAILDQMKRHGAPVNRHQRRRAAALAQKFAEVTGFRG